MTGTPGDRAFESLGAGGIAVFALFLAGSVLLVSVPLAVGLGAAVAIPGLGDFKPGVLPWTGLMLIGFLLAWRSWLLTGLFSLVVTSMLTVLVATVIASLVLLALKPAIDRFEAKAPRH